MVVLMEDLEERLVALICCDVNSATLWNQVLHIFVNNAGFDTSILVLKVTSSNVKGIKGSILVTMLACLLAHGLDDTRGGALNLIDVAQVIPNESLVPQVLAPIFKEKKCVEMYQQSGSRIVISHHVHHGCVLKRFIVDTNILSVSKHIHNALFWFCIYRNWVVGVLFPTLLKGDLLHLLSNLVQMIDSFWARFCRHPHDASIKGPKGGLSNEAHPHIQLFGFMTGSPVPIHTTLRGCGDSVGVLWITDMARQYLSFQKCFHRNDFHPGMLSGNGVKVKKVGKGKSILLLVVTLGQQVHTLFRRHDESSTHGMRQRDGSFHGHADVVPTTFIGFKGQVFCLRSCCFER
mmetsp:Transcript_19083/g.31636  ORF Transcript_19083/g.31636 Transcript_19083/m.31636 type:complete len:348 (-) Transcript_19083:442-1485(-)